MPVRQRGADKRFWHSCSDRRQTGAFRAFAQGRKCLEQPIGGLISSSLDVNIQRNPKYLWHNALLHPCNAWILAPGSSQRPNKMKKNMVRFLHVMNGPLFDLYFQIHNQVRRPHHMSTARITTWTGHYRAHGYPKIPVISRTSSCFSVSQRLSRWRAWCHLPLVWIEDLGSVSLWSWWLEHVGLTDWPCWNLLGFKWFGVSSWCQRPEMKGLASICDTCCCLLI